MSTTLRELFAAKFVEPSVKRQYGVLEGQRAMPPFPIVEGACGIRIPQDDLQVLLACASWNLEPSFAVMGRSALVERLSPLRDKKRDREIGAYKIKGCGALLENGTVMAPAGVEYRGQGIVTHMGIRADGALEPILDPPKPYGGLKNGRGQREFENARRLFEAGVLAVMPIYWGKYPTLEFEGKPMEFVILGIENVAMKRFGDLFEHHQLGIRNKLSKELVDLINRKVDYYDDSAQGRAALIVLSGIMKKFGEALRGFHTKGQTIRFAGHGCNYSYDDQKDRVILHDLDSCVHIDEVDPKVIGLSKVRDLESALLGIFETYWVSEIYAMVSSQNRRKHDLFCAFLEGYFGNSQNVLLKEASQILQAALDETLQRRASCRTIEDLMRWIGQSHQKVTVTVMHAVMPLYQKDEQKDTHPLLYGPEEFERRYARFTTESRATYEKYCRENGLDGV